MKKNILFIFVFVFSFFSFNSVFGAEIFFEIDKKISHPDTFILNLKIDTQGESINSFSLDFNFDEEYLDWVGLNEKDSLISFWVERPENKNGVVSMAGVLLGGAVESLDPMNKKGGALNMASFYFKTKKDGEAKFNILNSQILKNDGLGTELYHSKKDFVLKINESEKLGLIESKVLNFIEEDEKAPLPFVLELNKISFIKNISSALVFSAIDEDSGIKEYKIKKGFSKWQEAQSPYLLNKSIFPKNIKVRAYDYAGNYQEASVFVPGVLPLSVYILLLVALVSFFYFYKLVK